MQPNQKYWHGSDKMILSFRTSGEDETSQKVIKTISTGCLG